MLALKTRYHFTKQVKLSYPLMLGQLSQVAILFFDTLMIGKYDSISLAAATVGNALYWGTYVFIMGMIFGLKPLAAEADASGESDVPKILFSNAMILFTGASLLFVLIFEALVPYLSVLDQAQETLPLIEAYSRWIFWSAIFQSASVVTLQYVEALGYSKMSMAVNLIGNFINIFLNYLLIFGNMGFPELGIEGAGIGTLVAKAFMFMLPLGAMYVFKSMKKIRISWRHFVYDSDAVKRLFNIGLPIGLQMLFESGFFAAAAVMAGKISATAAASHQVVLTLSVITYMATAGLGQGATTHVANMIGFKFFGEIKKAGIVALLLATGFMGLASLIFMIFKTELPLIFLDAKDVHTPEITTLCASIIFYVAAYQIADGTQVVAISLLRGVQDVKIPTVISLIAYWLIGLTSSFVFGIYLGFGLAGIWLGLTVGLTASSTLLIMRFFWQCRKMQKTVNAHAKVLHTV